MLIAGVSLILLLIVLVFIVLCIIKCKNQGKRSSNEKIKFDPEYDETPGTDKTPAKDI